MSEEHQAAEHVRNAQEEIIKARRNLNRPTPLVTKSDEILGDIENVLSEMAINIEALGEVNEA